jgi:hypothetical protein
MIDTRLIHSFHLISEAVDASKLRVGVATNLLTAGYKVQLGYRSCLPWPEVEHRKSEDL